MNEQQIKIQELEQQAFMLRGQLLTVLEVLAKLINDRPDAAEFYKEIKSNELLSITLAAEGVPLQEERQQASRRAEAMAQGSRQAAQSLQAYAHTLKS